MFYHYFLSNKRFAFAAVSPDTNYGVTTIKPPSGLSKWNGSNWVLLNDTELNSIPGVNDESSGSITTPGITSLNSIPLWGNATGDRLIASGIKLIDDRIDVPYSINVINEGKYLLNGYPLFTEKDRQEVFYNNDINLSSSNWTQLDDLELTTASLIDALYEIKVELSLETADTKAELDIGLFINDDLYQKDIVSLIFRDKNDSKLVNFSINTTLNVFSDISIRYKLLDRRDEIICNRRKLTIQEL